MELLSTTAIWGVVLFVIGILILTNCSSMERENHSTMQKRRTLKLYGRRKRDAEASILFDYKGSLMTFTGTGLSLMGLFLVLSSIAW